jgi:hypothetical protein
VDVAVVVDNELGEHPQAGAVRLLDGWVEAVVKLPVVDARGDLSRLQLAG